MTKAIVRLTPETLTYFLAHRPDPRPHKNILFAIRVFSRLGDLA